MSMVKVERVSYISSPVLARILLSDGTISPDCTFCALLRPQYGAIIAVHCPTLMSRPDAAAGKPAAQPIACCLLQKPDLTPCDQS